MIELSGIPVSPGIAVAPALVFREEASHTVPSRSIMRSEIDDEWGRFLDAVEKAKVEVEILRDKALCEAGEDQAAIFDTHLLMLSDPEIHDRVQASLREDLYNIERIIVDIESELVLKLSQAEDPVLRERATDIHDVSGRILGHLLKRHRATLSNLDKDVILVARDLLPSDMISMDRSRVKAVVTEAGGKTSHVAILARAFEMPAVLGVNEALAHINEGTVVAVDGSKGVVTVEPDTATLKRSAAARDEAAAAIRELDALRDLPAVTTDGRRVLVKANIEIPEEVSAVVSHGADGVGLFRSEFLFLGGHVPDEEEQYRAYRSVIETMGGKPVTIRTLDIGGDKVLPELGALDEKNPLLGWRAIRFCLSRQDIFKTQLRAILRAAAHGEAKIMFPMIATSDELDRALAVLESAREECKKAGSRIPESIQVGIMIETPSAAMTSDILAHKADFFSIGTNDLIQYTMAVDRGNEKVAYLHEPYHPAVLRLIQRTIENAKAAGIPVGMCGEMAADPDLAVVLLGLGLDEFSMSSAAVPAVKRSIRSVGIDEAGSVARAVMSLSSSAEVASYLASRRRS